MQRPQRREAPGEPMDQIVAEAKDAFAEAKDKRAHGGDEAILEAARDAFEQASEAEADNRREALDDIKFARLGEQWPEYAVKARGKDRPMLVITRLPASIRQVVNDARQNRPAIKVRPVDDNADPVTAEVMNPRRKLWPLTWRSSMAWPVRRLIIKLIPCGPRGSVISCPQRFIRRNRGPSAIRLFFSHCCNADTGQYRMPGMSAISDSWS